MLRFHATGLSLIAALIMGLATPMAHATTPTDAQIAEILMCVNKSEINMAKLAKNKTQNSKIKRFASQMIKQHRGNNKTAMFLEEKNDIEPRDSDKSRQIRKDTEEAMTRLQKLKGKEFDEAYIAKQVEMHDQALSDLENTLIPAASNSELKSMLIRTKGAVAQHLTQARKIKAEL